jgi:uncharacterized membrane protein YkoI
MVNRKKLVVGTVAVAAVLTLGAGTAVIAQQGSLTGREDEAPGHDDTAAEQPITGPSLEKASQAALAHVGGGKVTGTETGDEEGFYEVEITRADGGQVDVHLNRNFDVLGTEDENATEDGS